MQSGNGIDLAAIHQLLTEVAQTVRGHSERFERIEARLDSHTEKLNELVAAVNRHSRKMDDLSASLGELRLGVQQYHSAVIGHGIELTGLAERVKRIEDHLHLGPVQA